MHRAPGIAKKSRSSDPPSRKVVSKTLVSRFPPQNWQDDRSPAAAIVSVAGAAGRYGAGLDPRSVSGSGSDAKLSMNSAMRRGWDDDPVTSIGGRGTPDWYPGSTPRYPAAPAWRASDDADHLRGVAPQ